MRKIASWIVAEGGVVVDVRDDGGECAFDASILGRMPSKNASARHPDNYVKSTSVAMLHYSTPTTSEVMEDGEHRIAF